MLWGCFDPIAKQHIYPPTLDYIRKAYSELIGTELSDATENPIIRVFLLVTGDEDNLQITESFIEGSGIIRGTNPVRTNRFVTHFCNVFFKLLNLIL